jgi:hypothetical protein
MVFVGDQLASVPNFGVDTKFQTNPKEFGLEIIL